MYDWFLISNVVLLSLAIYRQNIKFWMYQSKVTDQNITTIKASKFGRMR